MTTLSRELRKKLETTVRKARRAAEEGALKAIEQLAVHERESYRSLKPAQRALRQALRAHGKQLGDTRYANGTQETTHLTGECAYEQWHRLLFARYLAENDLLIEPESGVAISVDDCRELATGRGVDWRVLAGEFAERMLPQIFRQGDPVLDVVLPPESRQELEALLDALPTAVFTAADSLGWTYQFWQADAKDAVNASGVKIGANELAPVTQLFTEDYMVLFLLHNTLGAWWAAKRSAEGKSHEIADYEWTYLRFKDDGTPAAGEYEGWPGEAKDITMLDPCMGSGHFLVFALPILVAFRMEEEGLSREAAVTAVLRDNLYGLELDARCTQIAAFNLALAAWKMVGYCPLPPLNLACSGLGINAPEKDWLALAGDNQALRNGMARLYELFKQAPVLGSLINPATLGTSGAAGQRDSFEAPFADLKPMLDRALAREIADEATNELAVTARGVARAAELLAKKYTLVATNVPYLGRGKQDDVLKEYCQRVHPNAKADVATCFVERCGQFVTQNGTTGVVVPLGWMFLASYTEFRRRLLHQRTWDLVAKLGPRAFEGIGGEVVSVALLLMSGQAPAEAHSATVFEVPTQYEPPEKAHYLREGKGIVVLQSDVRRNPDSRIAVLATGESDLLSRFAAPFLGLGTGDYSHYGRVFWEFASAGRYWTFQQGSLVASSAYGGREHMVAWDPIVNRVSGMSDAERVQIHNQDQSGQQAWSRCGVSVSLSGQLPVTIFTGEKFDKATAVIVPRDEQHLLAIYAFASSPEFSARVRALDKKPIVANGTLVKVPFDLDQWQRVAFKSYPNGLPTPNSSDPTQWLFNGHPRDSDHPLHVAVARLVGYRWPRQTGSSFPDCPALGADGLEPHADADGIVPLTPLRGEASATDRLRILLAEAYGAEWSVARERELLAATGTRSASLDEWLRDDCFAQHCALFHQRPFVWHIWDGRADGFHALVNYHKLAAPEGGGRRTLEALTFTYLGDWIERQRSDAAANVAGADARLAAASHLQRELQRILAGEPRYDIFVRWKPLAHQPIGWEPDINDGVRLNIRPFMTAKLYKARGKGARILRTTPSGIKSGPTADRGNEPARAKEEYPWFWSWDEESTDFAGGREFDGYRWNDLHYSRAMKEAARARAAGAAGVSPR